MGLAANDALVTADTSTGVITDQAKVATANLQDGAVTAAKLGDDAATNAKLADMPQATVKGRASGVGTGDPVDLTAVQLATILGDDTVVIGATQFEASISGVPTRSSAVNLPAWLLDASAQEQVGSLVGRPLFTGWSTATVQYVWAPSNANAGTVRFGFFTVAVIDGVVPTASGFSITESVAPGVTNQVEITAPSAAVAIAATTSLSVNVYRDATHANDTYDSDAKFIAVILTKAS